MLGEDLAGLLARLYRLFHDQGLGRIDDETTARLRMPLRRHRPPRRPAKWSPGSTAIGG
ncbi:MAG: hypothetical protein WDM85_16025 [Caulobacteraceae bacterium]